MGVWLPDGRVIEYAADARNRRIAKKVNGAPVEGFLYDGQLRPVAWLDGAGQVYATFVYGLKVNVPEYMTTAAGTFRILTDHLGSPRLVVNTTTGAVAQRMDYDAWGQVLADTNPGFQPFGFAGGLWDRDTGLVRFGARDYDASTGRWTNKDPLVFEGGDTNIYAYVGNDPVNLVDPSGLCFRDAFARAFVFDLKTTNHFFFSFPTSLARTALGALTAGATAQTFGTVTPLQAIKSVLWPGLGPRGVATLGGVGGTLGSAALNMVFNAGAVAFALEGGIVLGSLADATYQAWGDDAPCQQSCGGK